MLSLFLFLFLSEKLARLFAGEKVADCIIMEIMMMVITTAAQVDVVVVVVVVV